MITWQTPAGSLGILTERDLQAIEIQATSDVGPITYSLIAGSLPRGLRLTSEYTYDSTHRPTDISKDLLWRSNDLQKAVL